MCRDFDRIDDDSSLRASSNSHNSRDMFMRDMFRVARHAMREARDEQAFWNGRRGNFNLGRSESAESYESSDNRYGMRWADLDLNAGQSAPFSEAKPAVYPWSSALDWKEQIPTNLTFLRSLPNSDSASDPVVGQEAVAAKPKTQDQAQSQSGFGPVPEELIVDNGQAPTRSVFETIAQVEPEPAKTEPEVKAPEVKNVEQTTDSDDTPQPIIRNEKSETKVTLVAMQGDRNLVLADMRDFRNEIEKPLPPVVFEATALDAYQKGLAEKKPVVLIIGEDWCQYCKQLEKELAKPEFQQYAGRAVFAKVQPSKDPSAKAIADALDIKNYPAISILEPNPAMIEERGRIVGFMEASKLDAHLQKLVTPVKTTVKKNVMLASVVDEQPVVA